MNQPSNPGAPAESRPFEFDAVFSCCDRDEVVVRPICDRLSKEGLSIRLDVWRRGNNWLSEHETGLKKSRVVVLCYSQTASNDSVMGRVEASALRLRPPQKPDGRLIVLQLDEAFVHDPLAQFLAIRWQPEESDRVHGELLKLI